MMCAHLAVNCCVVGAGPYNASGSEIVESGDTRFSSSRSSLSKSVMERGTVCVRYSQLRCLQAFLTPEYAYCSMHVLGT